MVQTREAPDVWGLHKNTNCAFPSTSDLSDLTLLTGKNCVLLSSEQEWLLGYF